MSSTEPADENTTQLQAPEAELFRLEPIFHRLELGTSREDFDRLTDSAFWETGASGRIYSREHVWSVLEERYASSSILDDDWRTSDFGVREIAPSTYLLTYTLELNNRITRRTTIWQKQAGSWKALYHQGTVVADP